LATETLFLLVIMVVLLLVIDSESLPALSITSTSTRETRPEQGC
jgi:hypothetical protein